MKRSIWILAGILLLLAVATFVVLRQPGEVISSGTTGEKLALYDSASVDRIEIFSSYGNVKLSFEAGKWMLTSPVRYPADDAAVTAAISKGKNIELKSLISGNRQKQQIFQVDSAGTLVKIFELGTEETAFRVGKGDPSYTGTYVRREESNDVYLADGMLTSVFARPAKDWRNKTIFKAEGSAIGTVVFRYGDTTFTLARADSLWRVDGDSAVETTTRSFLGALSDFQTDEFVDSTLAQLPDLTCEIEAAGTKIRLYFDKVGNKYYVLTSQSPQLFEVQSWRANQILKRKKDFLPPTA